MLEDQSPDYSSWDIYRSEVLATAYAQYIFKEYILNDPIFSNFKKSLDLSPHAEKITILVIKYQIQKKVLDKFSKKARQPSSHEEINPTVQLEIDPDFANHLWITLHNPTPENVIYNMAKKYIPHFKNRFKYFYTSHFYANSSNVKNHKKIAITQASGLNAKENSDDIWIDPNTIRPDQILYIIENQNNSDLLSAKNRGYYTIVKHNKFIFNLSLSSLVKLLIPPLTPKSWIEFSLKILTKEYLDWKKTYTDYDVQFHCIKEERSISTILPRAALETCTNNIGGTFSYQRSEYFYPPRNIIGINSKSIIFAWGKRLEEEQYLHLDNIREMPVVGYWNPTLDYNSKKNPSTENFTICLLDNVSGGPGNPIRDIQLFDFYNSLVSYVKQRPNYKIKIKTKKSIIFEKLPSPILSLINELKNENRCTISISGESPHLFAAGSNLAIGIGGIATSLTECALSGIRSIYYDPTCTIWNGIHKNFTGKHLFTDIESLIKIIDEISTNPLQQYGCWNDQELDFLAQERKDGIQHRISQYLAPRLR